jgi:hypothetical protein
MPIGAKVRGPVAAYTEGEHPACPDMATRGMPLLNSARDHDGLPKFGLFVDILRNFEMLDPA